MWTIAVIHPVRVEAPAISHVAATSIDALMVFGFVSVFFTLVFCIYQSRSSLTMKVFAVCLTATALYGFLAANVALGLIAMAWLVTMVRRILLGRVMPATGHQSPRRSISGWSTVKEDADSRISRMFGST